MAPGNRVPDDRRALTAFVGLAAALSWSIWVVWYLLSDPSPLVQTVAFAAGGFGPSVAGMAILAARKSRPLSWLRDVLTIRRDPGPYAAAFVIPVLAVVAAGVIHVTALGGTVALDTVPELWEYPIFVLFVMAFGGGQEEAGWRGFLLPALQREHSPLGAAVVVGIIWATWHLPLFAIPGSIQAGLPIWLYVGQLLGMSVILTWITNRAEGAIVPAMLLHAGGNAVLNYYPVGGAAGATTETGFGVLTGVVVVVAVGITIAEGRTLGRSETPDAVNHSGEIH